MEKKTVTIHNILLYKNIVDNHYRHYLELMNNYDTLNQEPYFENLEEKLYKIQSLMDEDATVILVFAQMTIEAFCNTYLLQHFSKNYFKDKSFIDKVNLSITSMLKQIGIIIEEKDANNYYGADIPRVVAIRKKCVHRYPICIDFDINSDDEFEKSAQIAAEQIEEKYLRRIKRSDIENAATAYRKFKDKLIEAGINIDAIGFLC